MNAAQALTITAAGALLLLSRQTAVGQVEADPSDLIGAIEPRALVDDAIGFFHYLTESPATVPTDTAESNLRAFLAVIRQAEGTAGQPDPYRVCYGYRHTINSLAEHPTVSGEWPGERLTDDMCRNAGFGPGCRSTAAGAYQIIKPTWLDLRRSLGLSNFEGPAQDAAALLLVRRRGALEDVKAGRFVAAVDKCKSVWASLPGNYAKQGQRSQDTLSAWFASAGGTIA